ncbi:MAG TPA: hypothetical protein VFV67_02315 [Actinophytocola sp.]|uniref:hypothetical protein n=1 Tax=Actinophytocola sp. TaxID=1872138 RepID=UPI002DB5D79A|nr:hypothetical protein [Actinophytocola sp.]HEU5469460.1 hypothetical protein [Actinophytocola sp.]
MADWRTDDDIHHATNTMQDWFRVMCEEEWDTRSEAVDAAIQQVPNHMNCVTALDPAKIRDDYERLFQAAVRIGDNDLAVAKIRITGTHLAAWTGDAADRFKEQLTVMEVFCDKQQTLVLEMLRGVAAVYTIAVLARESYFSIIEAGTAAAMNVCVQQKAKETEAKISLYADVIKDILGMDAKNLRSGVANVVIDVGKYVATTMIDDGGIDQVANSYRHEADRLCQSLGQALDAIQGDFAKQHEKVDNEKPGLFVPLPAYCDVDSPDFSYERFRDTAHDPGPIGPQVEAERQKYVEEKRTNDTEIGRRLDHHGDKGVI